VLRHVATLVLIGTALGLLGSFAVARVTAGFVIGVAAMDPATVVVVIVAGGSARRFRRGRARQERQQQDVPPSRVENERS